MTDRLIESIIRLFALLLLINSLLVFAEGLAGNFDMNQIISRINGHGYRSYPWGNLLAEGLVQMFMPVAVGSLLLRYSTRLARFIAPSRSPQDTER